MTRVHSSDQKSPSSRKSSDKWVVSQELLAGGNQVPWKDMKGLEKMEHVALIMMKLTFLLLFIFAFICTLGLLADAFKLIGGKGIGKTIKNSKFIQNPISASIIGMVITLVLQSGSTLISVLVGMVAGGLLTVHQAIPIMLGSEMGASFMNALISLGQSGNRDQFRRAFAAATMNDVYNFLCYFVFLPVEIAFGIIEWMSALLVGPLAHRTETSFKTLSVLTDPVLKRIIQIDNEAINNAATALDANKSTDDSTTFVLRCINLETKDVNIFCSYDHFFAFSLWSDFVIGFILLGVSILSLIGCLVGIVQLMQSLLAGKVAVLVRRLMDQQCPSPFRWLTDYVVMVVGCGIVMVVQSSSVFRSALTPLVGIGVITLKRLYPLLLGANVGTTFTGVIASLSADPQKLKETMQIGNFALKSLIFQYGYTFISFLKNALCQTIYNLLGILLFYPIPQTRRIPITLAMKLGDTTAKYRWFALLYIFSVFFFIPAALLALSFLPSTLMVSIVCILVGVCGLIGMVNWLQVKCSNVLPRTLQNWEFLPRYFHSLSPYDRFMRKCCARLPFLQSRFINPVDQKKEETIQNKIFASKEQGSKHTWQSNTDEEENRNNVEAFFPRQTEV